MNLNSLGAHWNRYGETDPLWAILREPGCENGGWDKREFFRRGMEDVEHAIYTARQMHLPLRQGTALDFGCGVGRLTQGLACYFDEAHGVDIAPSMIEQARLYNPYEDRCRFHANRRDDLRSFKDDQFDFILSLIVTQVIRPDYVGRYIAEFMRVLAPGGLLLLQHPSHASPKELAATEEPWSDQFRRDVRSWLRMVAQRARQKVTGGPILSEPQQTHDRLEPQVDWESSREFSDHSGQCSAAEGHTATMAPPSMPRCEHYPIKRRIMLAHIKRHGGQVVDVRQRADCGPNWVSYRYLVTK